MPEKIKILIVDDDPQLLAVLEIGLGMDPQYAVKATPNAKQAVDWLRTEHFDLVVTDYSLGDPDIDGLKILRTARELQPHCQVTIITAYASLEISLEAIHLGAYDFLTKPFQLDELQLMVRNAARHIRLDQENRKLREDLTDMVGALEKIERQHTQLLASLRNWDEENRGASFSYGGRGEEEGGETKRRQTNMQIASYIRMGETIREQLTRERERIESMFERGLLSEEVYRRAMSRHLNRV